MGMFDRRLVVVTGATAGIGRELAVRFAAAGAHVIATGRNEAEGAETVAQAGARASFFRQDVASPAAWAALAAHIRESRRSIDVFVNNAGRFFLKTLADTTIEDFDELWRVNAESCWLGMKHLMPLMADGGAIVNFSSLMGQVGIALGSAYCASKGAITQLSKAGAAEGAARGIRVNSVHPGIIMTKMIAESVGPYPDLMKQYLDETPLRAFGYPGQIADGVLYLASDAGRHITGTEFVIDGGRGAD